MPGLVTVTLNGKGEMTGLDIDASLIKPDDAEILEDLVVAAHHADAKVEDGSRRLQEKMKSITGDLPIPPGMKLFLDPVGSDASPWLARSPVRKSSN